jgi:hypothetical protein
MSQFMKDGIMPKDTYGDWCVPPEDLKLIHSNDPLRTTSSEYIGTAYFYYELKLMEKFAKLLGKEEDAASYSKVAAEMKTAFNEKFLNKRDIRYSNNSHTVNILALAFDLVPAEYKDRIVDNLLQKILGESKGHVGNGIIGGQWLMRTLTNNGHADVAYLLASQSTYPSWGYMVEQGATTIWELWNGDHGDPAMNSGNHVMLLGDLIIWFYEDLAGIKTDPNTPAFKHIVMKPHVLGDLKFVNASYKSIYGKIKSNWNLDDNKFSWDISIPANTTATIYVPTLEKEEVLEGNQLASKSDHIKFVRWEDNYAVFEIGSGDYSFSSRGAEMSRTKPYMVTPVITPNDTTIIAGNKIIATITCEDNEAIIRYTLDGSEPTESSPKYDKPLTITQSSTLVARAFREGYNPSIQTKVNYDFVDPNKNGILWELYEGSFKKLPDFDKLKPTSTGKVYNFGLDKIDTPQHNFAIKFNSFIEIDKEGKYDFYTSSNDGSRLYIDDKLVVDNDGEHGTKQLSGKIHLSKGIHSIRVEYFQSGGSKVLLVFYSSSDISYQPVPGSKLFINK